MRFGNRWVLPLVLAAALLVGCTEHEREPRAAREPAAPASPPATSSPTPSANSSSESIAAPKPPLVLEQRDELGAAAAAGYFAELYAYTLATGDVSLWNQLSHERCEFCRGIRDDAVLAKDKGERYEGGAITLSDVVVGARDDVIGGFPVVAHYTQGTEVHRGADGSVISSTNSNSGSVRIDTLPSNDGWKILAVVVEGE